MNISKMASFRIDLEAEKRPKDISSLPSVAQKSCNCPPIFAPACVQDAPNFWDLTLQNKSQITPVGSHVISG